MGMPNDVGFIGTTTKVNDHLTGLQTDLSPVMFTPLEYPRERQNITLQN